jgi:predicted Fe-S protein YdhL (DUF1289 family)
MTIPSRPTGPFVRPMRPPTAESPCIKVCQLDLDDRCRGCGRTVDEIRRWRDMTPAERMAINARLGFVSHDARPDRRTGPAHSAGSTGG